VRSAAGRRILLGRCRGDNPSTAEGAVEFEAMRQPCLGLDGGTRFKFNSAISPILPCETQAEIDRL
jgi:predicted 3-demethylubiquinone-9 3-methyltransferase (glyoxalase superfamily)